jgi:hypothetical protein
MALRTLENVLNDFIKEYQFNPIKYFYEEDLRAALLNRLWKEDIFNIKLPITANNGWLKDYLSNYEKEIDISGIKSEYPSNKRFDIAFINPNKITDENSFNHYIFECFFAIEIKLSQKDNQNSAFKSDLEKLKDYKKSHSSFTGIVINFEQNPNYESSKVQSAYNSYDNLRFSKLEKPLSISENMINCLFISKNYILSGIVDAT